jgi:membrane-bound lytic murein transglycosylase D
MTSRIILLITAVLVFVQGCAQVPRQDAATPSTSNSPTTSSDSRAVPPAAAAPGQPSSPTAGLSAPRSPTQSLPVIEVTTPATQLQAVDLTREESDLFQRLRNGFSMPDITNDLVLYHQQWYLNRPDYLRRMVERSSLYLYYIVEELEKRGMPSELALLPMVESAYNPMALSRAKASGLWQFIPATGKRYKLDQNWWKDERRDIVASTEAALDYLQSIYEMHGDWHLALASYNWGEMAVGRAVSKNQALGLPTDYQSLTMPRETKNYVPKLQALKNIFNDPTLMAELDLPKIPNRPYFGTVTKTANIDVKVAAKLAGMPVQEFVALNPAHNRPVITSETPMVIPADKIDAFESNLEAHAESKQPLSNWSSYTLRPGDKLEKIAPRFGISVANLKSVNGIQGRQKAGPGFTLLVPGKGEDVLDAKALTQNLPPEKAAAPAAGAGTRTHTVIKGETLASIARRFDLTVVQLQRMNHLHAATVKPGTRLVVAADRPETRATTAVTARQPVTAATRSTPPARGATRITHYTVRSGDTLASIARQYKVAVEDLKRWNHITPAGLKPGRKLTLQIAQNP